MPASATDMSGSGSPQVTTQPSSGRCSQAWRKPGTTCSTGEMITGKEAERIGLVSKTVPKERVLDEALAVASGLGRGSQLRDSLDEAGAQQLDQGLGTHLRPVGRLRDALLHGSRRAGGSRRAAGETPTRVPFGPSSAGAGSLITPPSPRRRSLSVPLNIDRKGSRRP